MVPARVAGLNKEEWLVGRKEAMESRQRTCFCLIHSLLQYTSTLTPPTFAFYAASYAG